jgi:hypothetical protein
MFQMTSARTKPGVAFWATVVLAVSLLAYPLSFGPPCGLADRGVLTAYDVGTVYRPIVRLMLAGPPVVGEWIQRYARWCGGNWTILLTHIRRRKTFKVATWIRSHCGRIGIHSDSRWE